MALNNDLNQSIIIPYKNYPGGPGTFISQLTDNYTDSSFTTKRTKKSKIILVIVYFNPLKLLVYKYLYNIKIVLRLDGMAFPKFRFRLHYIRSILTYFVSKLIYLGLADHIVFQSEFVEKNITTLFGVTRTKKSLIYNGFCLDNVTKKRELKKPVNIAYWGSRITESQLQLLLAISNKLDHKKITYKLHIIGEIEKSAAKNITNLSANLYLYGSITRKQIYTIAERIDLFLMVKGSSSPNTLVECLAFNIPVVGFSNQGNKEIIANGSGHLFESYSNFDEDLLRFINGIDTVLSNYNRYIESSQLQYSINFTCVQMIDRYFYVFNNLIIGN